MTTFEAIQPEVAFGDLATPLEEALATTLAWYADRGAVPAH